MSVPRATLFDWIVVAIVTSTEPSNDTVPTTSPERAIFRAVLRVSAVSPPRVRISVPSDDEKIF